MKYKLKNARKFGWEGLSGWAYNSKDDFPNASAAYFEVTGSHGRIKNTKSDRTYFVLEGQGEFFIGDERISVEKGDVIIVPKDTFYDYSASNGILKLFLVDSPAFDAEADMKG